MARGAGRRAAERVQHDFTGVPPGDYFIAALTEVDQRDLGDTSFLEQVSASALKITPGEGEKKTQDLRLAIGDR
ncbi:MAG: hypothetical protein A3I61_06360 [Acidobacteria bacterium RIFCSPLOWO2_02_FULL_68_18]|nr:MAG: hypothetical protein A3I61_06360 [Acidobacteria bacterium RIFCSPLOWO2_02_FULL_68_18]OFW50280.1 MAG: hypothetical protein A3G77_07355 [Acidobacteria bacterium RIFCSPLOWO2_12_FULL_68_19]